MRLRLGAITISIIALAACGGSKSTPSTTTPSVQASTTAATATDTRTGETSASETSATASRAVHVAAAGDLACRPGSEPKPGSCQSAAVGDLVRKGGYDRFLALGDIQYEDGAPGTYELGFGRDFSGLDDIISPAPGNHDYETPDGAGYHAYFGQRAGGDGRGYYSFDLGPWHVVSLNSNCDDAGGCGSDSAQGQWLSSDLADSAASCTLAFWHHPRFSSGKHGNTDSVEALWKILQEHRADLVLQGHDHSYERFAPLDADGTADPSMGITSFVVGTGGRSHYELVERQPGSEFFESATFGILDLRLDDGSYGWKFLGTDGSELDAGSARCRV